MKAITYELRLTEPLLATQVNSGEPNSAISFPFVPGSMVRGALIRHYLNEKPHDFDLANDDDARRLFLDGTVQFLNAYPSHNGQRLLPKPFSWLVPKDDIENRTAPLVDVAITTLKKAGIENKKPKSPHGDFVGTTSKGVWLQSPTRQVNVHNFTDKPGRKQAGNSQVYRYEALAAGQTMAGVIVAADDVDLSTLRNYLDGAVIVLGGSHTGGYGRVEVLSVKSDEKWTEYTADDNTSDIQTITFLSDAIIRTPLELKPTKTFQKMRVVGGFNRKWGLPLPQSWAIQAGTVWKFDGVKTAVLQEWVENGVGERRAEGYGRVALNWHTSETQQQIEFTPNKPKEEAALSTQSKAIAQQMANRRLRTKLEENLIAALNVKKIEIKGLPSPTQLSRVRLAARRALAEQKLSPIQEHMDGLTGAKKDWDKAKFTGESFKGMRLWDWILEQSKQDTAAFKKLFGLPDATIAGVSAILTTETEVEFRARLIDGVMKLAVKKSQKQGGGRS